MNNGNGGIITSGFYAKPCPISLPKAGGSGPSERTSSSSWEPQQPKPKNTYAGHGRGTGLGQTNGGRAELQFTDDYGKKNHGGVATSAHQSNLDHVRSAALASLPVNDLDLDANEKRSKREREEKATKSKEKIEKNKREAEQSKVRIAAEQRQREAERSKKLEEESKLNVTRQIPAATFHRTSLLSFNKKAGPPIRNQARGKRIADDDGCISLDAELSAVEKKFLGKKLEKSSSSTTAGSKKRQLNTGNSVADHKKRKKQVLNLTGDSPAKKPLSVVEQALAKARKAAKKAVRKSTTDTDEEAQKQTEEIDIDLSDDDDDDLGERYASVMEAERKRVLAGGVPDPLLAVEEEHPDPTTLCPFCNALLPEDPSKRLLDLKDYLLGRPNLRDNPTARNPLGKRLPVVETASFCRRHGEEKDVIPEGKAKGWPQEVEWTGLARRIQRDLYDHLMSIIMKNKKSNFLDDAVAEWTSKGSRKMSNVLSEWGSFDVEQPGYYGPRGFELFMEITRKMFVEDVQALASHRAAPLDIPFYLRRVLVPEVAVELISRDLSISREEAIIVRKESAAYGKAMFATSHEEDEWTKAEEERENRESRLAEKQEEAARKKKAATKRKKEDRIKEATAARMRLNGVKGKITMDIDTTTDEVEEDEEEENSQAEASDDEEDEKPPPTRQPIRKLEMQKAAAAAKAKMKANEGGKWKKNMRGETTSSGEDSGSDRGPKSRGEGKGEKGKGKLVKKTKTELVQERMKDHRKMADAKAVPKLLSMDLDDTDDESD